LIFTTKIGEFARQKYGVTLSGDSFFNLFSQRLSAGHDKLPCKNPTISKTGGAYMILI